MTVSDIKLCLFASTPDIDGLGFIVKVLMGSPEQLCRTAVAWGYDGIEFMPDPDCVPAPAVFERALAAAGAALPVVNSGRMAVQGYALLSADPQVRRRSVGAFKRLIDFAACFGARAGLGASRGPGIPGASSATAPPRRPSSTSRGASPWRWPGMALRSTASVPA